MINQELISAFSEVEEQVFIDPKSNDLQRTDEWFKERAGKITGSRFADILPGKRGGYLKARETVIKQMVCETLMRAPIISESFKQTEWGNDNEPLAIAEFEKQFELKVRETGFVKHQIHKEVGCSPDGFVDSENAIIEVKCPYNPIYHLDYALEIPQKYYPQVQGNMWVTGKEKCYFISYDPRQLEPYNLFVHVVKADREFIDTLHSECIKAIKDYRNLLHDIEVKYSDK